MSLVVLFVATVLVAADASPAETAPLPPAPPPALTPPAVNAEAAREAEIAKLLAQLLAERTEFSAMRRDHQRQLDELDASRFVVERAVAARDADIATAKLERDAAGRRAAATANERDAQTALSHVWLQTLRGYYLPLLQQHLATAVDSEHTTREQAFQAAAARLNAPDATPADALQTISRLQETEEALGRSIERTPVRIADNREADGLRIGGASVIAPIDGGGAIALALGAKGPVKTDVPSADAVGVGLALQILQRRRSPEFADLFIPTLLLPLSMFDLPPSSEVLYNDYIYNLHRSGEPLTSGLLNQPLPPAPASAPAPAVVSEIQSAPPPPATTATDPITRLQADLAAIRAQKAQFATTAAAERKNALDSLNLLEQTEARRGLELKNLHTEIAAQQAETDRASDSLALELERQTLFTQALQSTREQLLERLSGSLEAAAQPGLADDLNQLRALAPGMPDPAATAHAQPVPPAPAIPPAAPVVPMDADTPATIPAAGLRTQTLLKTVLRVYARLLTATRTLTEFKLQVKRADGTLLQAKCIQLSLLAGFYFDPASNEAGVLVADASQAGVWHGETKGLTAAQRLSIANRIQNPRQPGVLPLDVSGGAALISATHQWNLLEWFDAGGNVMWPLLLVLIAGVIVIAERTFALLRLQSRTRDLLHQVEAALTAGRFDEAERLCDPTRGPVQRVLHAGLIHRRDSRTVIEDAIQAAALGEMPHLQKGLGMIALLAGLAPLLGLLGTVTGMINTFQMVNLFGSSDTRFLAGGISEALITTEFGLVMAIPFVFCHGMLTRLSEKLLTSIELGAAIVVQRLGAAASRVQPALAVPAAKRDTVLVTTASDEPAALAAAGANPAPGERP